MQMLCSVEHEIVGRNLMREGSVHCLFQSEESHNKPVLFSEDSKRIFQNETVVTMLVGGPQVSKSNYGI
jgi:hypothetical protein